MHWINQSQLVKSTMYEKIFQILSIIQTCFVHITFKFPLVLRVKLSAFKEGSCSNVYVYSHITISTYPLSEFFPYFNIKKPKLWEDLVLSIFTECLVNNHDKVFSRVRERRQAASGWFLFLHFLFSLPWSIIFSHQYKHKF